MVRRQLTLKPFPMRHYSKPFNLLYWGIVLVMLVFIFIKNFKGRGGEGDIDLAGIGLDDPIKGGKVSAYQALAWETKRREGFENQIYSDIGSPAIGFGCRLFDNEEIARYQNGITEAEANELFLKRLEANMAIAKQQLPKATLNQIRAVGSLFYTMGAKNAMKTELWKRIKNGERSAGVVSLWEKTACSYVKDGKRYQNHRLKRTRQLESALWMVDYDASYESVINKIGGQARKDWLEMRKDLIEKGKI
jgi:GH24 family phage-related lysozyme (muramidase)